MIGIKDLKLPFLEFAKPFKSAAFYLIAFRTNLSEKRKAWRTPTEQKRKIAFMGHGIRKLLSVVVASWTVGFFLFLGYIIFLKSISHPSPISVVFTGGGERVETGLRLLESGKVSLLFISGVAKETSLPVLLDKYPEIHLKDTSGIELGTHAIDTTGNALETAQWLIDRAPDCEVCTLIDSDYHLPRSLLALRCHSRSQIKFIPFSVSSHNRPWLWRIKLFIQEYHKFIAYLAVPFFGSEHFLYQPHLYK